MSLPYNQKYIVADCETSGLNLHNSLPWQLAWSVYHGNKLVKTYNEYLDWPNLQLSDFIKKLTGFNQGIYDRNKKDPAIVLNKFENYIYDDDYILIGQNWIGYDCYLLATIQRLCKEKQDFSYLKRLYDTRTLGKAYRENLEKPKSGDLLSWQYKILNDRTLKAKVSQLAQLKHFGIEFEESKLHDGVYDIEMTFKIFQELKKKLNL